MNKERLSQYRYLRQEVRMLQKDLIALTRRPEDPEGAKRVRETLLARRQDCVRCLFELEEYISSVNDSRMRQILSLRYRRGLSWQRIAFIMNESDESYPRRIHDRYLKQISAENAEKNKVF